MKITKYQKNKRRTRRNPGIDETYGCKIMNTDHDLRLLTQQGDIWAYGELIDYIGFLENLIEKSIKEKRPIS